MRIRDGKEVTFCAPARNTAGWLRLLQELARTNPRGQLYIVTDNLSSHTSGPIRRWLRKHPRIHQVFIPVGACWLNLQEGWWRIFRKAALAGQTFADAAEIAQVTALVTAQLNAHATPWVWGRPQLPHRRLRRKFAYLLLGTQHYAGAVLPPNIGIKGHSGPNGQSPLLNSSTQRLRDRLRRPTLCRASVTPTELHRWLDRPPTGVRPDHLNDQIRPWSIIGKGSLQIPGFALATS